MSWTKGRSPGQGFDRQIARQMSDNPRRNFRQPLGRIHFVVERLHLVLLLTRRPQIHDKLACDTDRDRLSVILLHEGKRHLDSSRPAAAGVERTVLKKRSGAADPQAWKFSCEEGSKSPVRRHLPALQQSARRHSIDTGGYGYDSSRLLFAGQPAGDLLGYQWSPDSNASRDND